MATYYVDGAVGNDSNGGTSQGAGNAWATLAKAAATLANGDICYVKATGVYPISAPVSFNAGSGSVLYYSATRVIGYATTPGDNGRATVQRSSGSSFTMLDVIGNGWTLENFIVDGASGTAIRGVSLGGYSNALINSKVLNCTNSGVAVAGNHTAMIRCEVTACSGGSAAVRAEGAIGTEIFGCYIHGNTVTGIYTNTGAPHVVSHCVLAANTGASSDGIEVTTYPVSIRNCVCYGNGRDGLRVSTFWIIGQITNNIFGSNSGYGLNAAAMSPGRVDPRCDYNVYWNNGGGEWNNVLGGPHDVGLSGNPFTNAAGGDFTLNNIAGAGAACRGAGFPGQL
jgi:hypothetical protein